MGWKARVPRCWRAWSVGVLLLCMVGGVTLHAAYQWFDGTIAYTTTINAWTGNSEFGTGSYVGFWGDSTTGRPRVGQAYYTHVLVYQLGNPSTGGSRAHIEMVLPPNTSLAISAENPVRCYFTNNKGVTTQDTVSCPQNPTTVGSWKGGYVLDAIPGPWPLATGTSIEIQVPVVSSTTLNGMASNSYLQAWVWAIDGVFDQWSNPKQGVYVFANSTPTISYPSPSATSITNTSAHVAAVLTNDFVTGTAYIDLGKTTSYGTTYNEGPIEAYEWYNVWEDFTSLTPGTTYHWRLRFVTSAGTTYVGADQTFTTLGTSIVAPTVTAHPANVTVNVGQTATFTAGANGSPAPTVKWQVSTNGGTSWSDIVGATSTTYSFTTTATDSGRRYRAVFTNSAGSATSNAATLTVNSTVAPAVTGHPASLTVNAGQTATFSASATGTPTPTVKWQVSTNGGTTWSDIGGAVSTTYSFTTATADNGRRYRAVFTNSAGTANSNAAILTVTTVTPTVGDINGDGKPDLLWRNTSNGQNAVWFMNGTTLSSQVALAALADAQWQLIGTADFNADGKKDLLWRNASTGQNAVWYMNGATYLSQVLLPPVADTAWALIGAADFNNDGHADLLWRNQSTGQNAVWYMNGATFVAQALLAPVTDPQWFMVGVGDFTADGKPDILWRHAASGQNVVWVMNGVTFVSQTLLPAVADKRWQVGMVADFNGDGKPDIVWRNGTNGLNVVWLMNGLTFSSQVSLPTEADTAWQLAGPKVRLSGKLGDFTGDGLVDLLWHNGPTGQSVVWQMNGMNFVSQSVLPPVPNANWQVGAVGDFSGDGKTDIVWRNASTGQNVIWNMNGVTFVSQTVLPAVADANWQIVASADINRDGHTDLIWRNRTNGLNVVWYMNGGTFVSQVQLAPVTDARWQIMSAGDFDGDGNADLVWRNLTTGLNVIWFLNGATFLSQSILPSVPDTAWQIAFAADFSGDGKADLVWRNATTGQNAVWTMNGATFVGQTLLAPVNDANWMIIRDRR